MLASTCDATAKYSFDDLSASRDPESSSKLSQNRIHPEMSVYPVRIYHEQPGETRFPRNDDGVLFIVSKKRSFGQAGSCSQQPDLVEEQAELSQF